VDLIEFIAIGVEFWLVLLYIANHLPIGVEPFISMMDESVVIGCINV
jgi:hypothetical protein